jgi:hypothetical protein
MKMGAVTAWLEASKKGAETEKNGPSGEHFGAFIFGSGRMWYQCGRQPDWAGGQTTTKSNIHFSAS